MDEKRVYFDIEVVGNNDTSVLVQFLDKETAQFTPYWIKGRHSVAGADLLDKLAELDNGENEYVYVGFNSTKYDMVILAAIFAGFDCESIKEVSLALVKQVLQPSQVYRNYGIRPLRSNHIDLFEVAPGVQISLKTYAGRLAFPTMVEHVDFWTDLKSDDDFKSVEDYCRNDLLVTQALDDALKDENALRLDMSWEYGVDLRSKSDAQIAESVMKTVLGLFTNSLRTIPSGVRYTIPKLIKTNNAQIKTLIEMLESHYFRINSENGQPVVPDFLSQPLKIGRQTYKFGLGGLHSCDDNNMMLVETESVKISDFDVRSYYPNILMKCGLIPNLGSEEKSRLFIEKYHNFYVTRTKAKDEGIERIANSLKTVLNGLFGKLGSCWSTLYSPDLMLAITLTGQLNLSILIVTLERIKGVRIVSANTDGIVVQYPIEQKERILKVFANNAKRTKFEYEQSDYRLYAAKDVNNYIAITAKGKVKTKGLYASSNPNKNKLYLMKNPHMEVVTNCVIMVLNELLENTVVSDQELLEYIKGAPVCDFMAIRNVKGGGIQHQSTEIVDDWVSCGDRQWRRPCWDEVRAPVKRLSRPKPVEVGIGGEVFGKVARWYMTTENLPPITYATSGNIVPTTTGARLALVLPKEHPADLDYAWYVAEARRTLKDLGAI